MIRSRVLAVVALAALAATPAFAYVNTGSIAFDDRSGATAPGEVGIEGSFGRTIPVPMVINRDSDQPSQPVPEPGTMALASMGLMALGAHLKKRNRGR